MEQVAFIEMKSGTAEEYHFLEKLEQDYNSSLANRILQALEESAHTLSGYKVNRLEHVLQAAARAEADGADEEMIVGVLIHDIGDSLAPYNHSQYAASIICSGQLIPDTTLSFSSARAGASPPLNW